MNVKQIETMKAWIDYRQIIKDNDYEFWQSQYDFDLPEGYHAGFRNGNYELVIITHNEAIKNDILKTKW